MSTKVDNICGTNTIGRNRCLDILFKSLVKSNSTQFKVSYNCQKFPGLFIEFCGNTLSGTLIDSKYGKINSVGLKRPDQFLKLDEWVDSKIQYVRTWSLLDCVEYVCIKCGIVLCQGYILEEKSFKQQLNENKDPTTYSNIHNILDHLNLVHYITLKK